MSTCVDEIKSFEIAFFKNIFPAGLQGMLVFMEECLVCGGAVKRVNNNQGGAQGGV